MYAIEIQREFCASHQLRLPGGNLEPLHGHNWCVTVRVEAETLDGLETVMDFHVLDDSMEKILAPWDNHHLNTIPPFDAAFNPSAERVAERIGQLLAATVPPPARVAEVRVSEAPRCVGIWRP